ncbi:MAG TPA: amidase, partial [Burkholderiaceae bacterium]|nr:amidase [Burkholderiaceae bacterium]
MADLHQLDASELAALYRSRKASPVEAVRAVIAHIERCEPKLHALYAYDPEAALSAARASEARWAKGQPLSPLDGVPGTLKENIASKGTPVPVGTAASLLTPAAEDAPPAARWREAGAVLLAKTTMPDYGMLSSGLSSFHKLARNPWDLRMNPGGSSAGAGAASAAGYGPLHVGTDIGGSIRLPAGWCGVFGLKPSLGRIPIKPPYAGRVAGPMTRTVMDAALLMAELSKPDWRDTMSLPYQAIEWTNLQRDVKGLKLGLQLDAGWGLAVAPEVRDAIVAAARSFEAAGAIVEPMPAFSTRAHIDGMDRFWRMRSWLDMQALPPERRDKVLPYIRAWADLAATDEATRRKVLPYILAWAQGGRDLSGAQVYDGMSQML